MSVQELDKAMEQNKVLMVIVSVAIFFAAIIGVGVALLYPRGDADGDAIAGRSVREFDPIEYVRNPEDAPLQQGTDEEPVVIVYGDQDTADPGDGGDGGSADASGRAGTDTDRPTITNDTPDGTDGPEITITERPARQPRVSDTDSRVQPDGSADTAADSAEASSATDAGDATASSTGADPQPRQIRVTEYWIQLIASPSRDRVEQARGTLADYSLGGRVTTRDVDGELFYRLRVGPYESEGEAEKFLEWIQDIEGFEGAYISEEYPLRSVTG